MRFVNDDVKLKNGGRNAIKITEDDLWEKMCKRAIKIGEDIDEDAVTCKPWDEEAYSVVRELICCDPVIRKDIKFSVDAENILTDEDGDDQYLGLHETSTGLVYYGLMMGGDWEVPVFLIIYWDGKKLRAYVPSYGNLVNLDAGCAFGSEEDNLDYDQQVKLLNKYTKYGDVPPLDEFDFQTWSELYCRMYDETQDGAEHNFNAMIKDIEARIIVS